MNIKEKKEVAKQILKDAAKKEENVKFKAACIGMDYNAKGQFHSLIIEVEASFKHPKGEIDLIKNVLVPISLTQDVNVFEPKEKPKEKKKTERKSTVTHAELS